MTSQEPDGSNDNLEEIYARFMKGLADGEFLDIADLYAEYPEFADELRELHGQQETVAQTGAPRANSPAARVVQVQGKRYGIISRIAIGGMGVVYKVWDGSLRRELAMKLIRDKRVRKQDEPGVITNPETVARFIREAEITATLDHPGIVPIHDMGEDEHGRVFFTMRLVQGKRLDQVFELSRQKKERWSLTRVLDVIVKICETLAFAHSRGVIHRDLKPANIMVGQFGETYVMDWGLAKTISRSDTDEEGTSDAENNVVEGSIWNAKNGLNPSPGFMETSAGSIMGTACYMPPEQAAGLIGDLDERSDVYSVGAILYELLTDKRPYLDAGQAPKASEIVQAIKLGPPAPLRTLDPKVSKELAAICDKAMSRKREDRFKSMEEMAKNLRAYQEDRVVEAYQTGAYAEVCKWVVRNRPLAISIVIAMLVAIGGLTTVVWVQNEANKKLQTLNEKLEETLTKERNARAVADQERRRAEGLLLAKWSSEVTSTNPALALRLALESDEQLPSSDANSAILAALPLHHEVRTLYGHRDTIISAAVNREATRLVTGSNDHTAIIWDIATGNALTCLVGHTEIINSVKFSPDGQRIATASYDQTVALWDAKTGQRLQVLAGQGGLVWQIAFSPDSQRLASGSLDGNARIWDLTTNKDPTILRGHSAEIYHVEFSPDGKKLLTGSGDKTARVWDIATAAAQFVLPDHEGGVGTAHFSADGHVILTAAGKFWTGTRPENPNSKHPSTDCTVQIWDAATGIRKRTLTHPKPVITAKLSSDGSKIVSSSVDGIVRIWNNTSDQPEPEQKLDFHESPNTAVAFSPDGGLVAAGSDRGSVRLWDAATGKVQGRLGGHTDGISTIDFISPSRLITTSKDHTARLWNTTPEGAVEVAAEEGVRGANVVISPNIQNARFAVYSIMSRRVTLCGLPWGDRLADWNHATPVSRVQFSPSGKLAVTLSVNGVVRVFSAIDGQLVKEFEPTGNTPQLLFCGDRQLVVVEHSKGIVTTWDLKSFKPIQRHELPGVKFLRVSPDGRYLLVWFGKSDELELRTISGAPRTIHLPGIADPGGDLPVIHFSNDGSYLVTWSTKRPSLKIWKTKNGELQAGDDALTGASVLAFAPDGCLFVTNSAKSAPLVWDSANGKAVATLSGDKSPLATVFTGPRCENIVTRAVNKLSRLWDGRRGTSIGLLADRDDFVESAWFNNDGNVLLTLNDKKDKVTLWNPTGGQRRATIFSNGQLVTSGALTGDGEFFVTGLADGTARIWPVNPVKHVKSRELRRLTPDEYDLYKIGSDEQRVNYRIARNEANLIDFLTLLAKVPANDEAIASIARRNAQQAIEQFIESLPADFTKAQRAEALARVKKGLHQNVKPALAVKIAPAELFVDR